MTQTTLSLGEFEATLSDQTKLADIVKGGKLKDFLEGYVEAKSLASDVQTQVKEQTELVLKKWLQDNADTSPIGRLNLNPDKGQVGSQLAKNKLYNTKAPGAAIDKDYTGSADFMQAIWHHAPQLPNAAALAAKTAEWQKIRNSFGSQVPADGGFLIPETMRSELLQVALETAIVRPRARVIPMDSLRVPIPMVDSTSNASTIFGGITAYWTEEGATLAASQAKFGRAVLEAKKLTAYTEVPNELVADAPAFQAFLNQLLPEAIAWYEDLAFLTGTGVGEPLGIFNGNAVVQVAKEAGQAADTIVWENIVKMFARMLPSSLSRAVWIAGIDTFPELATMALTVGTGGSAIWLNNGVEGPPMTILGRPVIFTEKAELLGDAGDISFVDFGYYLIGDRQVMQAQSSADFKFSSDQTAYRIIERVDGRPWLDSAITPANGSTSTLSPIVKLAARA